MKSKTALVTGSTSGIGLGIARALAARGANVVLNGFGDPAQIDAAWALMQKAERPLFVIGRGVMKENAVAVMEQLATATGIPVTVLQYSPDAFPATHPLALGPLGRNAFSSANKNAPKADVIVAVGAHFDVFSTLYKYGIFSENAKIIHNTSAPGQIGIVFPVELGVAGSAASFIKGLAERAAKGKARRGWM